MSQRERASQRRYGLDAPGLVRASLLVGAAALVAGLVVTSLMSAAGDTTNAVAVLSFAVARAAVWLGGGALVAGLAMLWSNRFGKPHACDALLDTLGLHGGETVLDVGCGNGMLLIAAARRVPRGKVIGVEWRSTHRQAGGEPVVALATARSEGMAERVSVLPTTVRHFPLPDASVDCVVSYVALHAASTREERRQIVKEITRVLRPGGCLALLDVAHTAECASDLRALGCESISVSRLTFWTFPPSRRLEARKPDFAT